MSLNLLNENTVVDYLISRGVIESNEKVIVEELTGGVSNTVLSIKSDTVDLVLKQALPVLKVAQHWEADPRRAVVEANALKLYNSITPYQVPNLVFLDPEAFVLIMERVPRLCSVWRSDLLSGKFDFNVAEVLGNTLAKWHLFGEENYSKLQDFQEDELFEQLRIDPFYRFVASKNPTIQNSIQILIDELEQQRITLVHGDFSPKNIMVSESGSVYVLDFEVTHLGNPVFDLAFLLGHLMCKFFRAPEKDEKEIAEMAIRFTSSYQAIRDLPESLAHHTALISLARVEGKSPVDYLDSSQQKKLQTYTKEVLSNPIGIDTHKLFDSSQK
jgi:5-methylthioribose kinase